ncbi:unnamed protein product [marine sediment metagenome]|uniref:Uncharacterized protein n=1 Tax=marine sediment metagenome TaxID=412755 RepID=X0ZH30_9ZZZZ
MANKLEKAIQKIEKEGLINRLQEVYDNNNLNSKDEVTILDTIALLGGEIQW